ncbi:MAG: hypothetical protein IPK19_14000 [Chloroflexi bacterium]|nr:hypothetical protein [Chloroflexota bacterium]
MIKRRVLVVSLVLLLTLSFALPMMAQEGEAAAPVPAAEESGEVVSGAATLMLLLGAGAVLAVGGLTLLRDSFKSVSQG